jgi:hypothetical protein
LINKDKQKSVSSFFYFFFCGANYDTTVFLSTNMNYLLHCRSNNLKYTPIIIHKEQNIVFTQNAGFLKQTQMLTPGI